MPGLPWFELDTDFADHPKCARLGVQLRDDLAFGYVVRLYSYCYRHVSDRFEGDTASQVVLCERAAGWKGKAGLFVAAALAVGFLDQEEGALVVHGVDERLAPHLRKREKDATRARERRANVAATPARQPRDVRSHTDRDRDRDTDRNVFEPASHSEQNPRLAAGCPEDLGPVAAKLAAAFGREQPLKIGKEPERVRESFGRWLRLGLHDELHRECLRLAAEKNVSPQYLSWWPGWLDTVPDADLERIAAARRLS